MPNAAEIHGAFPIILDGDELSESAPGQLDSYTFSVAALAEEWETQLEEIEIVRRSVLPDNFGFHSMWVSDWRVTSRTAGVATIAINCLGLASASDKRKVVVTATATRVSVGTTERPPDSGDGSVNLNTLTWDDSLQQWTTTSAEGVISVLGRSNPAWSLAIPKITVTETYFTTSAPSTNVAANLEPSIDITAPVADLADALNSDLILRTNYPSGWVLDERVIDPLFTEVDSTARDLLVTTGIWAVTDKISYYFDKEPG